MRRYRLPRELDAFADFINLPTTLRSLAVLAAPEAWQFKTLRNMPCKADEILLRYLLAVYHRHVEDYGEARDQAEEDESIYIDRRFACFHTGLYRQDGTAIYMVFVQKTPGEEGNPWAFRRFVLESDWWIRDLKTTPLPLTYPVAANAKAYASDWLLHVEYRKMLMDMEMREYLPVSLRTPEAFQPSMKAAISQARNKAAANPDYAVPVVWQDRIEYALPLYLNGWTIPDVALLLRPERDKTYTGHHLMLPERAYMGARLLGPIRAGWMKALVVQPL